MSPPLPTHLKTRTVVTAPPCVKVPETRMSLILCSAGKPASVTNVPAVQVGGCGAPAAPHATTGFWKNQKLKSLLPFVAKRSAPKYRN